MTHQSIRRTIIFLLLIQTIFLSAQPKEKPLFLLGETAYYTADFKHYFLKNNKTPDRDSLQSQMADYLDLYINFKLKVQEAVEQRRDEEEAYINEFNLYKKQLAEPYLMQTQVSQELLTETYERLKVEIAASHILIRLPKRPTPEDTVLAFDKAQALWQRVVDGEPFDSIAAQYSQDPSAKSNKGYLGYFSAMRMVYAFENAAYLTEVGEISRPFRTDFGYHVLKVIDKRPARGKMLVAHLLIRLHAGQADDTTAKTKALMVYENLSNGANWDEQCRLYSEDPNNKNTGGKLKWFGTGNFVPTFEDAAFALDTIGQISAPVKTRFGYHIIKKLDEKGLESFEEMKPQLEKQISRDSRSKEKKSVALTKLKALHHFNLNQRVQQLAFDAIDSTLLSGTWQHLSTNPDTNKVLFEIGKESVLARAFWQYVEVSQKRRMSTPRDQYVTYLYNQFEESRIFEYEMTLLEAQNFEYKMILDEYKSGILLFALMEEKVWNKAVEDSAGMRQYYQDHLRDYEIGEHAIVREFAYKDSSLTDQIKKRLGDSKNDLDSIFNNEEPLNLQVFDKTVLKGEDEFLDAHWQEGHYLNASDDYLYLLDVQQIKPDGVQALNKIRGIVISDYQGYLEENWLKELKNKYPIKINKTVWKSVMKSFEI